jgi:hypothetical protein
MVISNEDITREFAGVREIYILLHGAEIVAEVQPACRLDAGHKYPLIFFWRESEHA